METPWTLLNILYHPAIKHKELALFRKELYIIKKDRSGCIRRPWILESLRQLIEDEILPGVTKPLRYVGNEYNVVKKDWDSVKIRMLFAFPDIYEVGMSHLGMRILYHLVNEQKDVLMERVFAPWTDMEQAMREKGVPLFSLETYRPVQDFDCIGFTLQYEMSYTNVLNMLDLGKIPLLARERGNEYPLVIAGGPCAYNPEPLADFIDLFVIGEGEEVLPEILQVIAKHRQRQGKLEKADLLRALARITGVYVPAFYEPAYGKDAVLQEIRAIGPDMAPRIVKRVVKDLDHAYFPLRPIVPYLEIVHDRIMLEVLRGCSRGCRFCQAGMVYRPVRERKEETLKAQAGELLLSTGYNEISLTSLSTSDYTGIEPLVKDLLDQYQRDTIGISLPSLRVDSFSLSLARQIQRVRKAGLTFAPEAGTQRLRDVINKRVTEENLMEVTETAFRSGWTQMKLYFMIGLPAETREDLDGIADLARKVLDRGLKALRERGSYQQPKITVSVSSFVPKPHTPFQWEGQDSLELLREKQQYLKNKIRDKRITFNYHESALSMLEAVFAKGNRRLGDVLLEAWRRGCKFDSWSECFRYETWLEAFRAKGMEPGVLAQTAGKEEDVLPWDHIDIGVTKDYLWQERTKAYQMVTTGDCREQCCQECGVCQDLDVQTVLQKKGEAKDALTPQVL